MHCMANCERSCCSCASHRCRTSRGLSWLSSKATSRSTKPVSHLGTRLCLYTALMQKAKHRPSTACTIASGVDCGPDLYPKSCQFQPYCCSCHSYVLQFLTYSQQPSSTPVDCWYMFSAYTFASNVVNTKCQQPGASPAPYCWTHRLRL